MTRFCRENMPSDRHGEKSQIPDDIENFMPNEFLRIPHGFLAHHRFPSDDDRILQTPPLDQSFCEKRFDFLIKNKGPGSTDLLGIVVCADLKTQILRVMRSVVGIGAGNFEPIMRQRSHIPSIRSGYIHRLSDLKNCAGCIQLPASGLPQHFDKGCCTPIPNRRFVRIQFDQCVVDLQPPQSGQ